MAALGSSKVHQMLIRRLKTFLFSQTCHNNVQLLGKKTFKNHPKFQSSKISDFPKATLNICFKFSPDAGAVKHLPQHFAGLVPIQEHTMRSSLELAKLLPDNYEPLSLCGLWLSLRKGQRLISWGEGKKRLGWDGLLWNYVIWPIYLPVKVHGFEYYNQLRKKRAAIPPQLGLAGDLALQPGH